MTHEIRLSRAARRALEELQIGVSSAVWAFIEGPLAENPRRLAKPLSGNLVDCHSARRGSYRVVYRMTEDPNLIDVPRIDHRRGVYR